MYSARDYSICQNLLQAHLFYSRPHTIKKQVGILH